MEEQNRFSDELIRIFEEAMEPLGEMRLAMLAQYAGLQKRRAERLTRVHARLEKGLGEDDARVKELRAAAAAVDARSRSARETVERAVRRPRLDPEKWTVFGRIEDKNGEPLEGLQVRIHDASRRFDKLLGTSDEFGEFSFPLSREEVVENHDLYVEVSLPEERRLFTSERGMRFSPGRAQYFSIEVESGEGEKKATDQAGRKDSHGRA